MAQYIRKYQIISALTGSGGSQYALSWLGRPKVKIDNYRAGDGYQIWEPLFWTNTGNDGQRAGVTITTPGADGGIYGDDSVPLTLKGFYEVQEHWRFLFFFEKSGRDLYLIRQLKSDKVLDIKDANPTAGDVILWSQNNANNQLWKLEKVA